MSRDDFGFQIPNTIVTLENQYESVLVNMNRNHVLLTPPVVPFEFAHFVVNYSAQ